MIAGNISDISIKSRAAAWAVGIHIVLLLLFLFIRYSLPAPEPLQEMGIEVNLGTDMDGSGDDQPMAIDDPAAERYIQQRHRTTAVQQPDGLPDMERSDDPDAPEVGPVSNRNNQQRNTAAQQDRRRQPNRQEQQTARNQPQPQRPRYVYSGGTGAGGNRAATDQAGTSEGNTTGSGDRGVPGGTPGAENYEGSPGNGTGGISHSLRGRTISPARFEAEFREGGKVVVQVTVDREGNITDAKIKSAPNPELSRIALQKIKQARFSKITSGEPQAFGEVTIIFKARS